MDEIEVLPTTLEEAFEILKTFYKKDLELIKKMDEKEFLSSSHFWSGMFLRNSWLLWWHNNHGYDQWPDTRPKIECLV